VATVVNALRGIHGIGSTVNNAVKSKKFFNLVENNYDNYNRPIIVNKDRSVIIMPPPQASYSPDAYKFNKDWITRRGNVLRKNLDEVHEDLIRKGKKAEAESLITLLNSNDEVKTNFRKTAEPKHVQQAIDAQVKNMENTPYYFTELADGHGGTN
jgi:hypothetical protein